MNDSPATAKVTPRDRLTSQIESNFAYHRATQEMAVQMRLIRGECRALGLIIRDMVPEGREQALALTNLEQVTMWCNAGISRQAPIEPDSLTPPGPEGSM